MASELKVLPLDSQEFLHALDIATKRHDNGTPSLTPNSGWGAIHTDLVGTMAEVAVCKFYREDYYKWVTAYDERPGAIPDLIRHGMKVSIKGRERWVEPLDLIVPEHDIENDIYILVSVDVEEQLCALRGWISRQELLQFPAEAWKWTDDRPGSAKPRRYRYISVDHLHECRQVYYGGSL